MSALLILLSAISATAAARADDVLQLSGIQGGLVVHLGAGDADRTAALRASESYQVHGLTTAEAELAAARARLRAAGVYGPVSVDLWDGRHLPYSDNLVNLIVAEQPEQATQDELLRALAPRGVLMLRRDGGWTRTVKPWPETMDDWTHYLHGPDGNPVAEDQQVASPERLQWIGTPRWSRHHDHMASLTSLVSSGGRLFYILDEGSRASIQLPSDWRLIARDAFNGTILWKRQIAAWNTRQYPLKSGPADLLRRLVAVDDAVYVTLGLDTPVSVLDAATGEQRMTLAGSEFAREIVVADGVVLVVADSGPSKLPNWRRVSTYVWDNTRLANPEWGWQGNPRKILAFAAASGRMLWKVEAPVAPCSLAVAGMRIVVHDGARLVCLDRDQGSVLWQGESAPTAIPVHTNTGPRVVVYGDVALLAANDGKISGWSLRDGKKLWEQRQRPSGHQSLRDLMVVDGLVWTGEIAGSDGSGVFTGYDPATGEVKREFPPDVQVHWFHHRCYPAKASGKYLLTARNGTEFIDLETEHWKPNHWVRGGCITGVMPCNGILYAGMDACGCQLEAKLPGLKALAAGPVPRLVEGGLGAAPRLARGPAFGAVEGPEAAATDWPAYRHDAARSGASSSDVPAELGLAWQAKLGGRLSPPTIAAGMVFVSSIDEHTVHALDAGSGKELWSCTAGGRVDTPPTYYRGLVLFGSADGSVYALRASDGALAWRFRAAPVDRRIMAWEQLESAWPVHGSVLVHDGVLYCTAGRSMFLDGGIHFLRLDPISGELLGEVVWDDKDPESGEEMHLAYLKQTQGNNMPVALSDILSCDGRNLWMRSQKIDFQGRRQEIALQPVDEQPAEDCHLFCQVGFLDDDYFFRTYWTYGRRVAGGYGAWMQAGRLVPSGRILAFDDTHVFGYGRRPEFMTNASVLQYQLFASSKEVTREAIARIRQADAKINARSDRKSANSSDWLLRSFFPREDLSAVGCDWIVDQPAILARAMALGRDAVFVAGPENLIDERYAYRMPDAPEVQEKLRLQAESLAGGHGGVLWSVAKQDGRVRARLTLDTVPVFDGLAAADGRLFLSTVDGRVLCLSGSAPRLPSARGPESIRWDGKPEDPSYLKPAVESKAAEFDQLTGCQVVAAGDGYRVEATVKKQAALALKKLAAPLTRRATFTTQMTIPAEGEGLKNGFFVFGGNAKDDELIKCGVRLRNQRAMIVQGPLAEGKSATVPLEISAGKPIEYAITVDLESQRVRFSAGGQEVEAALEPSLSAISYIGYAVDGATVDFAPIEVIGE